MSPKGAMHDECRQKPYIISLKKTGKRMEKITRIKWWSIIPADLSAYLQRYLCTEVPFIYLPLDLRGKVTFQSLARHTFTEPEMVWPCDNAAENTSALMWNHHNVPLLGIAPGFRGIQRLFITEWRPCGIVLGNRKTWTLDGTDKYLVGGISCQILSSESLNIPPFFRLLNAIWHFFYFFSTMLPVLAPGQAVKTQSGDDWSKTTHHISSM